MEHKAFVFGYAAFEKELKPLLEQSLKTEDCSSLKEFISKEMKYVKDPYQGEPLEDDWEDTFSPKDVHDYGDFALTKYYQPSEDIGLGYEWEEVHEAIMEESGLSVSPVLGLPVGMPDHYFDPGKMGSYFQTPDQVRASIKRVEQMISDSGDEEVYSALLEMLLSASDEGKGLYVTF